MQVDTDTSGLRVGLVCRPMGDKFSHPGIVLRRVLRSSQLTNSPDKQDRRVDQNNLRLGTGPAGF